MNDTPFSPPTPAPPVELLTPQQMALRLSISRRSLSTWTRDQVIPMIKIGRVCRFDFAKVLAALEKREVPVKTQGGEAAP